MAVTKNAARTAAKQPPPSGAPDAMPIFVWEGNDKRGVKMKGEQPRATRTCCAPNCASRASPRPS